MQGNLSLCIVASDGTVSSYCEDMSRETAAAVLAPGMETGIYKSKSVYNMDGSIDVSFRAIGEIIGGGRFEPEQ